MMNDTKKIPTNERQNLVRYVAAVLVTRGLGATSLTVREIGDGENGWFERFGYGREDVSAKKWARLVRDVAARVRELRGSR